MKKEQLQHSKSEKIHIALFFQKAENLPATVEQLVPGREEQVVLREAELPEVEQQELHR